MNSSKRNSHLHLTCTCTILKISWLILQKGLNAKAPPSSFGHKSDKYNILRINRLVNSSHILMIKSKFLCAISKISIIWVGNDNVDSK